MNKYQTREIKFLAWFVFVAWSTAVAASAQINRQTAAPQLSTENLKFKREFTPVSRTNDKQSNQREFISAKKSAVENVVPAAPPPRQTYVRPTKEERFNRYAADAFGVPALISATFGATFGQIGNDPPEWEKNIGGFGKRYASAYATNAIRNTISYGLSETFRLDNRFEKSGQKGFGKRLKHVFLGSYTTRTPSGRRLPDFPYVTGTYAASIIANETWYPDRYNYRDGVRDGTVSLGVRFGVNLLREFVFPK